MFGDIRQGGRRRAGDAETKPVSLLPDRTGLVTRVFVQACPFSVIPQAASADTPHEAGRGLGWKREGRFSLRRHDAHRPVRRLMRLRARSSDPRNSERSRDEKGFGPPVISPTSRN